MKYFKCGNCQKPYKIDDSKVTNSALIIECTQCKSKNMVRFGPVLVAQSGKGFRQTALKLGVNTLGRKSDSSTADIQLDDQYISKEHASIFMEEKEGVIFTFIMDNKSLNGTFDKNKSRLKPGLKYPLTTKDFYIAGLTKISLKFN